MSFLKNDVNVIQKGKKIKNFFVLVLKVTDKKSMIQIRSRINQRYGSEDMDPEQWLRQLDYIGTYMGTMLPSKICLAVALYCRVTSQNNLSNFLVAELAAGHSVRATPVGPEGSHTYKLT